LQKEILELREQKTLIRKEKPLVWSIEFAEIFAEKGGFDIVIGNPPYVRQEAIADPTGKIKDKKQYKGFLQEMVKLDFPNDFPAKAKINAAKASSRQIRIMMCRIFEDLVVSDLTSLRKETFEKAIFLYLRKLKR
jgi:hypothetical protein